MQMVKIRGSAFASLQPDKFTQICFHLEGNCIRRPHFFIGCFNSPLAFQLPDEDINVICLGASRPSSNSPFLFQSPAILMRLMPVILPPRLKPNNRLAASPRGKTSFTT